MIKSAKENISDLEKLGYFKYAKPEHVNELKKELERSITDHKQIYTVFFNEPEHISKCYRYIYCDHEELIESMAEETLGYISFTFDKIMLPFEWKTIRRGRDQSNNLGFTEIMINGRIYILYSTDWSRYAYDFVNMINDQLLKMNSNERLYLITPGNDGDLIFLDKDLKEYFDNHISLRETFKPIDANDWIVKYKNW